MPYLIPHPPHSYSHQGPSPNTTHRPESITFAGAGLVCSLVLLFVQLILAITLCRAPSPAALVFTVLLVIVFLNAVGSFGRNVLEGDSGRETTLAWMLRIARAVMVALETFIAAEKSSAPPPKPCSPPYLMATPCWPAPPPPAPAPPPPAPAPQPQPQPQPQKEQPKKEEPKKQQEQLKKEEKKEDKKEDKKEEKRKEETEIDKLVKKYLEILKKSPPPAPTLPPAPAAPPPAPAPAPAPPASPPAPKPKPQKPKPPPDQPASCYRDGKRRVKTWFSRDGECWGTVDCGCGCRSG
ncbi:hypothetical protein BDZ90DRAFT_15833 [Jaminaea rosea]|uniref:Uncharacterized protein n=1 Tax=Jaminaea rosea TaxID=1569628 RepID=A0A316UYY2_9BASI|nr:hypothetical protein BDZ90DRAFT_15833 [Jaminaea rosea]PWN30499.1 hypothetical protein BDZ90DRAFT_15833 [Jaminaea rosea]